MEERKYQDNIEEVNSEEYITESEAKTFIQLFKKYLKLYKHKDISMTDKEWLEWLFKTEIPGSSEEEAKKDAEEIVDAIEIFDENLESVNEAAKHGISKESWLADKLQEASVGMSVNEYGKTLQAMDDMLYQKNMELAEALKRSGDGHIKMSPNLDGNIAEHMVAKSAQLSADLQGENIKIEVLDSYTSNSVDVRATNLDTGKYQNYQLKFGKNAQETIKLIERGNYNNQRLVVPTEQLQEIQEYFKEKGSSKTITDHIDAWGAKGKSFTKEEMKNIQIAAQEDGIMPNMDYSHYQTKDLAMSIGKNAGAMALQAAAVTTGLNIAAKLFKGEPVDADEMVEVALKTGKDTSVKVVSAGTLQVAIKKGIIKFIPKTTPAGVIANIACVGIENVKILKKIASGDLSLTKGLDQMGRTTTSMIGGLAGMAKGASIGAGIGAAVPVIGPALAVATGFVGGTVGYLAGSKVGDVVYNTGKKVAAIAKNTAKVVVNKVREAKEKVMDNVKNVCGSVLSFLGF